MALSESVRSDPPPPSVLLVDDSRDTREVIHRHLAAAGFPVYTCSGVDAAVAFLEANPIDMVITDVRKPPAAGLHVITYVREKLKETETMMVSCYPPINGTADAVGDGAGEYLIKPFTEDELMSAINRMVARLRRRQAAGAPQDTGDRFGIIGSSPEMAAVFRRIGKAIATEANVLISGDSGTGKELAARAVHYHSARRAAPFVPVNCAAIPDSRLESELFGHVKGAFTGARESRAGFFEIASDGTVFLDEIGDASLPMQTKLLRVLQEGTFCMVGASRQRTVNTRVIAATRKHLPDMVLKGRFSEDLYCRLDAIDIRLPPLCERGDDILRLLRHFAETRPAAVGDTPLRFTDDALQAVQRYSWPGNIRELETLVRRLMATRSAGPIDITDLPPGMRCSPGRTPLRARALAEVETEHILTMLGSAGGNKSRAAEILGIDRKTLREKLKRIAARQPSRKPARDQSPPA